MDFIVDMKDEYVFLELKPAGRLLFAESYIPDMLLLDTFARFLSRARAAALRKAPVRIADYFKSKSYEDPNGTGARQKG